MNVENNENLDLDLYCKDFSNYTNYYNYCKKDLASYIAIIVELHGFC